MVQLPAHRHDLDTVLNGTGENPAHVALGSTLPAFCSRRTALFEAILQQGLVA